MIYADMIENKRYSGVSFLKTWVLSLTLFAGIVYPLLVFFTLNYSGKDPSIDKIDYYYIKKDAIAKSFGSEPKFLIIGGSSAFYGIDTSLMEKKLNTHVVNYGQHAGLGLEYQLNRLLRILNNNDSLLLAFEGPLYATESNQFSELLQNYVFTYDQSYLLDIDSKRAFQKLYGIPFRDFWDSWKVWEQTLKRKKVIFFSSAQDGNKWISSIDRRGNHRVTDTWVRPILERASRVELKPYAIELLKNFMHEAKKRNVKIFFTWPTTYRRADFLSKDSIIKGQELLQFLQAQGIVVIDDYADHLYPLPFYTDTPYHLSRAGTHVRTEKMIESLRPYFGQKSEPQKTTRFFLLDERNHKIEYFKYDGDDRYDFKVYANQSDSDYMLDDSGIKLALKQGQQVYFSDEQLKPLLQKKFRIETASCNERSLEKDIQQYSNHIFFMILNHIDEVPFLNKDVLPKNFYDALSGKGYRIMVLGTGKYSDIDIVKRDEKLCEMTLNREKSIENILLPFDLHMVSTKKPLSRFNVDQVAFFERDLNKQGLWMLVYDPDLGIIVDKYIYPDMTPQPSACLYRMRR